MKFDFSSLKPGKKYVFLASDDRNVWSLYDFTYLGETEDGFDFRADFDGCDEYEEFHGNVTLDHYQTSLMYEIEEA